VNQLRSALLLSIPFDPQLAEDVRLGKQPQPDYLALMARLNATLIAPIKEQPRSPSGKLLGFARTAWAGFRQRDKFDVIVSDVDRVGLLLALMLKLSRSSTRHIVICHSKMLNPLDSKVLNALRLHTHIHRLVCYGQRAAELVAQKIPGLADRVTVVQHGQDHHFWQSKGIASEKLIVGAGLFRRDYETLVKAVEGIDASVEVAAHSPWVTRTADELPERRANVTFRRHDYQELRALYDRALCVAVPLMPTHSQAGSLVVYEAMAMGKPVIVTRTDGQASMGLVEDGKTGFYVNPFDAAGWREAIQRFVDDPTLARQMGQRAREKIEAGLNIDAYVEQMAEILCQEQEPHQSSSRPSASSENSPRVTEP
jgi:glycosyltransferase involved in cell wall biosynthesis